MGKVFEDYFSELQTDMVEICMEYVEDRAEKIYIYCSFEGGVQSGNFFYKVNGKVVKNSRLYDVIVDGQEEYDVSIPRQRDVMAILNEDMVALRKLCEEYQREMPTQIFLIFDVAVFSLNVGRCLAHLLLLYSRWSGRSRSAVERRLLNKH